LLLPLYFESTETVKSIMLLYELHLILAGLPEICQNCY